MSLAQMLDDEHLQSAEDMLNEIRCSSETWRSEFLAEVTEAGRELYRAALYDNDRLWTECKDLYGQGQGYRNRVAERIQEWFEDQEHNDFLDTVEQRVRLAWNKRVIQPLCLLCAPAKVGLVVNVS